MESRQQWLENRKKGIGGSDVAPILGVSPFKTALDVYNDKLSLSVEQEETQAMKFGKVLEPVIRQMYVEKTNEQLVDTPSIISKDFMIASLDGMTKSGKILEVKTARMDRDWGEPGTSEIPIYYTAQVQHYLMVTGAKIADIAVLIGGSDFRIYTLQEDKELQEVLFKKESKFWEMVQSRTPPEPSSNSDISFLYPKGVQSPIEATQDVVEKIGLLSSLNNEEKEISEKIDGLKFELKVYMKEHDGISIAGRPVITFKNSKNKTIVDWEAIAKHLSEKHNERIDYLMAENSSITEGSRRFLIK